MYLIKDSEKIQTDMYLVIIIFIVVVGSVIFRGKELEEKTEKQQMRINMLNKFNVGGYRVRASFKAANNNESSNNDTFATAQWN